ncbi:uncharacterized protein G2W53_029656 [Senna tora]|uniref:Uncharacterized protein n=1 Tax=Senna tora TaxID=362788 RepID=A0A834T802_9FABA|nr:uncharacterized protein G2W53_029656 [Senna tora]
MGGKSSQMKDGLDDLSSRLRSGPLRMGGEGENNAP